jgi:glycosyltransferase involved in cell wall biosynthesis
MASPNLSLILPAYNEAGSIVRTLTAMQAYLDANGHHYEIIVSADGDDGTRELAGEEARRDGRIRVIGSPGRHGKGKGIRSAVAIARGAVIGFLDADYKVVIDEVEKVLPWLDRGSDVVIGSRAMPESQIGRRQPLYRRWGSRGFGFAMHCLTGLWQIRDTQCGFKFFRAAVARDLFGRQRIDGYMFDVEILCLAARAGYRIKEVGVDWRDDGDSRLDLFAGNWRNLVDLFRIRFGTSGGPAAGAECSQTRRAA